MVKHDMPLISRTRCDHSKMISRTDWQTSLSQSHYINCTNKKAIFRFFDKWSNHKFMGKLRQNCENCF